MLALAVDLDSLGITQRHFGMAFENRDTLLQKLRLKLVVMSQKHEIVSGRESGGASEIPGDAAIRFAPVILETRIAGHVLAANRFRAVGRAVVREHHLKILEGLLEDGLQSFGEIIVAVVHRHPNAHPRLVTTHFLLASNPGFATGVLAEANPGLLPGRFHSCQGALPLLYKSSSSCFSLKVSMLFQKPSYSYPTRFFPSISRRKGSCTSSSPSFM